MQTTYNADQMLKLVKWLSNLPKVRLPFTHIDDLTYGEKLKLCADYEINVSNPEAITSIKVEVHDFIVLWRNGSLMIYKDLNDRIEIYALNGRA